MTKFYETVLEVLRQDNRFFTEDGALLRNAVYEAAMQMDSSLLRLLLSNEKTKTHFFKEVDGIAVFDKVGFGWVLNNKEFLPDSYTRYKNKIGLADENGEIISSTGKVELVFPYKDCVLEGGQTRDDQEREEVFYNESLAPDEIDRLLFPKVLVNPILYDKDGEKKITNYSGENLIIKGNNLLCLASLLKIYEGKIQLINIDPPYNTGSDSFKYNDRFKHSSWLTFMKNRLSIAHRLLKREGFICCQVNESESYYLKVLMDEIFGASNYLATLFVKVRYAEKTLKQDMDFHKEVEQILIYRKSDMAVPIFNQVESGYEKFVYRVVEKDSPTSTVMLGNKRVDIFAQGTYEIIEEEGSANGLKEIWASGTILDGNSSGRFFRDYLTGRSEIDGLGVMYKVYGIGDDQYDYRYFTGPKKANATKGKYYQGVPVSQLDGVVLNDVPINSFYDLSGSFGNCRHEGGVEFRSGKKPEVLYQILLHHFSRPNDIVLDFFLGSGTTCAVACKMNRRFIGTEQLDYGDNDSIVRIKNVIDGDKTGISKDVDWHGGSSFIYCELAKANQNFVEEILVASTVDEIKEIYTRIIATGFISSKINPKNIDENAENFDTLSLNDQKRFLIELLDKNLLYVNFCDIDDVEFAINDKDKEFTKSFYGEV